MKLYEGLDRIKEGGFLDRGAGLLEEKGEFLLEDEEEIELFEIRAIEKDKSIINCWRETSWVERFSNLVVRSILESSTIWVMVWESLDSLTIEKALSIWV